MDGSMFDRLTQTVGGSRRHVLRTALAGAAVATAGVVASGMGGDAKKKKKCKKKACPKCESKVIGATCVESRECCGTETNMSCAFVSGGTPSGLRCCGTNGVACDAEGDCCANFTCDSGTCVAAP